MKLLTHNMDFHLDEIISTAILRRIYPESTLRRSRNADDIADADIVYDVSGIYDPAINRYDHHQRSFNHTFSEKYHIKLSSAGLIYKHFHKQLLGYYGIAAEDWIVDDVYEEYFMYVDAQDNGIDQECAVYPRTLAALVKNFNINERRAKKKKKKEQCAESSMQQVFAFCSKSRRIMSGVIGDDFIASNNYNDRYFLMALNMVSLDMDNYFNSKRAIINQVACNHGLIQHSQDCILIVEHKHMLSREALYILEQIHKKQFLFIIYKNSGVIRIYGTIKRKNSFEVKVPLCLEWGGLEQEVLQQKSGIKGALFVHSTGFTGSASDLESAIQMCRLSINKY